MITSSKISSDAVLLRQLAQALQVARLREHDAHVARDRLDDDGRRSPCHAASKSASDGIESLYGSTIVSERRRLGHAGAVGDAEGRRRRSGLRQEGVAVAVVAALELDDLVAAGEPAREAERAHHGLGARS